MGGLELQTVLRERNVTLPVVVLTAHGDVATTRTALKNGAVDFLEKPVDDEVLVDVLRNGIRLDEERHRSRERRVEVLDRVGHAISPRTVEVYKARMMEKLQCRTLAEVVRIGTSVRSELSGN